MSNKNLETQKIIERCSECYETLRQLLPLIQENGQYEYYIEYFISLTGCRTEIAALEIMGLVDRKECSLSAIADYPYTDNPVEALRAHYDVICHLIKHVHAHSSFMWYAKRADSFEQFVGLCVEEAEKRYCSESYEFVFPESEPTIPPGIFAQCIQQYDSTISPLPSLYDDNSIVHSTLIMSGVAVVQGGKYLAVRVYDGKQEGKKQIKKHMKALRSSDYDNNSDDTMRYAIYAARSANTHREFIKKCCKAAMEDIERKRIDDFHAKLDAIGCP